MEGIESREGQKQRVHLCPVGRLGFASLLCRQDCLPEACVHMACIRTQQCILQEVKSPLLAFGVSSCGPLVACQGALFFVGQETSDMGRDPLALLAEAIASPTLTAHSGRLLGN